MENQNTRNSGIAMSIKKNIRSYMMIIALVILWIVFAILTDGVYISTRNISNLFRQMTTTGVVAIGMAICIIAGYFDLSTGSVVGATGALAAVAMAQWGFSPIMAIILALLFGLAIGAWQGFWVAYRKIPAFIVTLGGQMIFRGMTLWITESNAIPVNDETLIFIGQGYLPKELGYALAIAAIVLTVVIDGKSYVTRLKHGFEVERLPKRIIKLAAIAALIILFIFVMDSYEGIPIAVIILLALMLIFTFVLNRTRFGRYVYAVGGNSSAAKLSGINNELTVMGVFIILGVLGALSGIILTGRLATAMPANGQGLELDAIAACVIGGVSLAGGKGTIFGAIIGALVMASLSNGMSLLTLPTFTQNIISGLVLIMAVWFDTINTNKTR